MPIPLIASVLAPIGSVLAQRGLDMLSGFFQGALNKGTEKVAEIIHEQTGIDVNDVADNKLTEEQWVKLKDFELQYQDRLLAYRQSADAQNVELERIHQQDRESARAMQMEALKSQDPFISRFVYYYAYIITGLTFLFIFYASFWHDYSNKESSRIIDTVLGFMLGVSLSAIIQYFFGSSQGSAYKQKHLETLTAEVTKLSAVRRGSGEGQP